MEAAQHLPSDRRTGNCSVPLPQWPWPEGQEFYFDFTRIRELGGLLYTAKDQRLLKELGLVSPKNTGFIQTQLTGCRHLFKTRLPGDQQRPNPLSSDKVSGISREKNC